MPSAAAPRTGETTPPTAPAGLGRASNRLPILNPVGHENQHNCNQADCEKHRPCELASARVAPTDSNEQRGKQEAASYEPDLPHGSCPPMGSPPPILRRPHAEVRRKAAEGPALQQSRSAEHQAQPPGPCRATASRRARMAPVGCSDWFGRPSLHHRSKCGVCYSDRQG